MKLKCGVIKVLFFATTLFSINSLLASEDHKNEMAVSFGVVTASFNETQSAVKEDASTTPATTSSTANTPQSGSVSAMSLDVTYSFLGDLKKNYYLHALLPLMSSESTGYIMGAIGMNFFLNSIGSKTNIRDKSSTVSLMPKFRYYLGPEAGIGYLIYATEDAEKSDVVFELGGHAGAIYNFKKDWGAKVELAASRGTGVATTSFIIKMVFGLTFYM